MAQILGPNRGVFGTRTLGRVYTCGGTWRLISPPPSPTGTGSTRTGRPSPTAHRCSTHGMPSAVVTIAARDCARARTVVRAWFHRLKTPGNTCTWADGSARPGICRLRIWRCVAPHTTNGSTYHVTCTADANRRRVRFVNRV